MAALSTPSKGSSKSLQVQRQLAALMRRMEPGDKLPKAMDLCRSLSISARTLNEALQDLENSGVIERRHAVGIFLARRPVLDSHLLLLCHPDFFNSANHTPFWRLLVEGCRQQAQTSAGTFDIHFTRPDGEEPPLSPLVMEHIKNGDATGVLGIGISKPCALFVEEHVPLVTLAAWSSHIVGFDDAGFAENAIRVLREKGCQRIGLWTGVTPYYNLAPPEMWTKWAFNNFKEALHLASLNYDEKLVDENTHLVPPGGGRIEITIQEQGYQTALRVFGKPRRSWPEGLLIQDELLTHGAWRAFEKLGIEPGRDVHIVTHSNAGSQMLLGYESYVDQLVYDPKEMVSAMFQVLDRLIEGQNDVPVVVPIAAHLVPAAL